MSQDLAFVALGGLGQIGRNAALYGYGAGFKRKWLLVDCGLSFAGPEFPGVELVFPDLGFIESIQSDLLGLVVTHAHEDHVGAISALWPKLQCPIHATPFAIGLLQARRLGEPGAPQPPLEVMTPGRAFRLGPFEIEAVSVAHSIPESCALAIRTPAGLVVHSGDWKCDDDAGVDGPTNSRRFRDLGDEGVAALVCDSTNILREGRSPSEGEVAKTLAKLIANAPGRVMVSTFASNLQRIKSIAAGARAAGRQVVVAGRSLERVIAVGRECGYLDDTPPFLPQSAFKDLRRAECVVIATGSQGEPRAAMAKIAAGSHPAIKPTSGDMAIFSSRTIPGNEREVNAILNSLVDQGLNVVTDRDGLVHCSGHPRREEVAELYEWLRPQLVVPAHGEAIHLSEHARFARECGVPSVLEARNGDLLRLAPGAPEKIGSAPHGEWLADGEALIQPDDEAIAERLKLQFAGVVSIALAVNTKGDLAGDPDVLLCGLPKMGRNGQALDTAIDDAMFTTIDGLPRARRRDPEALSQAIEKAVRGELRRVWGKKPQVHVLIVEV